MKYKQQYCPEVISSTTISFKTKQFCQILNKYYFLCWACSPFLVPKAQVSCTAVLACAQPLSGMLFRGCSRVTSSLSCHFSIVILRGPFKGTQVQHFSALSHFLGTSLSHTWLGYCWLIKLPLVQTWSIPQRAHTQGPLTAGGTICGGSENVRTWGLGGWTRPLEVCPWGLFHVLRTFLSPAYHKVKVHLTPWESKNPTSNQESKWILHSLNCLQRVFCRRIRKVANTSLESPRQVFFFSSVNQYTPRSCSMPTGYGGHSSVFCINLKKKTYQPFIFFSLMHFAFDTRKNMKGKRIIEQQQQKKNRAQS